MSLPNQLELQTLFSGFLFETGLSAVSVKNYLSDLRHFFSFCASVSTQDDIPSVQEIFQNISKYLNLYLISQKKSFTPQNTINRRNASIRRFSTFLAVKFGLVSSLQEPSEVSKNTPTSHINPKNTVDDSLPSISKILEHFKIFLVKEKKTHSTVKNYISDLNHFFAWSANETPFLDQNLENILSEFHLNTYVTYLKLSHTSTSVINRRQSSIKQFTKYCFLQKYIPSNPFEYKRDVPHLLPLSWFERLTKSKGKTSPSRGKLAALYQKYNSLPFTPYLHLAILVLATSAMVIFGYNQIIERAKPSSAALPTIPKRQLSFQGRLTDSSATPITTAVNVVFKLFNDPTAGTQLYTSGTCSIVPDTNGIFNTLIGGGTCGSEIANTVFTENRDVYLEVGVGAETLTPRQQIATVGYALNSETLQGYPASGSATINTVPIVDNNGDINIAAASPSINSTSGTFNINGQALTLTTTANSGGDIILQPDAIGGGQVQVLGATTTTDTLRIENANLTSGALISGYIGNNTATGNLLSLTSGSVETNRFIVGANGRTIINTNGGTDSIFSASSSGTTRFTIGSNGNLLATGTLTGLTGLTVASGTVSLPNGEINNAEISELDWTKLQNYPSACPAGEVIQAVGDTLTCVSVSALSGNLWQRTSGSVAPIYLTDALNLGSTATSSAIVSLPGTTNKDAFFNLGTGKLGIGTTTPAESLDVNGAIKLGTTATNNAGTLRYTAQNNLELYDGTYWATLNTGKYTKEITGFVDRTTTTLSFTNTSPDRTFTITGTNFPIFIKSEQFLKNTESIQISTTVGLHYIYYNSAGTLVESDSTAWDLSTDVPIATVYWNGTTGLLGDERHGVAMDNATHEYLHKTVGARYDTGLGATFTDTTFSIDPGSIYDEDLKHTITPAQTTTRVFYRIPAATSFTYTAPQTAYYTSSTGTLDYDNAGTRTAVSLSNYVAYWVFATNDPSNPIYTLMGQRQDGTLTNARNNNTYQSLLLPSLPSAELKLLYRVIVRNQGGVATFIETQDERSITNLPSGTYIATAHGTLTGLLNDDHTQYALLAGRALGQTLIGGSAANETLTLQGNAAASGNTATSANMIFKTGDSGGTTAMTILNNGSIGIGTTSPNAKLAVTNGGTGILQTKKYSTAGTYTFTVPADVTSVKVEAWGGGGGGGVISASGGGGGGGGAYARTDSIIVTPGDTITVVVGSGGTDEVDGGNSTFDTTVVVAEGGKRGLDSVLGLGGSTANSTGADAEYAGGNGGTGLTTDDAGGGGGGAGGKDGAGVNGGDATATLGGNGGAGNNSSGGAGGLNVSGSDGRNGESNVLGGGGGGGGDNGRFGGSGGFPGGGGGGGEIAGGNDGADGQVAITFTSSSGQSPVFAINDQGDINRLTVQANGNVGIGTTNPSSQLDITYDNLGTNQSEETGIALVNTTAAANNAQQISPALRWTGSGWDTTLSASQKVEFSSFVLPVQGTTATGNWVLASSIGDSRYTNRLTLTSAGALTITGGITATTGTYSGAVSMAGLTASTGAFSSTVTNTLSATGGLYSGGFITVAPAATALIRANNSPVIRLGANAWSGSAAQINNMDILVTPHTFGTTTSSRMVFKNTTLAGVADSSELMTLDSSGNLSTLGTTYGSETIQDSTMDTAPTTNWTVSGDWAYTTNDFTFTRSSGTGTITQAASRFLTPAAANRWYRLRYVVGVLGPAGTEMWVGSEFADRITRMHVLTTGTYDIFFKSNSSPGDLVLYTSANTTSGLRIDSVSLMEVQSGDIMASGLFTGGGTSGIKIDGAGNVGIGTTSPLGKLDLRAGSGTTPVASVSGATTFASMILDQSGLGDLFTASTSGTTRFTIAGNGDITLTGGIKAGGSVGSPGNILSSTGTGVQWVSSSSVGSANQGWSWDTGVLYPTSITDAINLGNAATASATVHLAGTAGDNSFINTGNFGIGLTNPGSKLTVVGSLTSSGGNISLNNDSNFTTNINTGTSTGAVTIGGGSNTVAVNSSSWDITTLGVASGFTGFSSSGNIDLASLNAGGIVKADVTTGRLSIASAGTDYEVPLTFSNGLTRSVNAVKLGGALTANTDIPLAGFNLAFSGTGNVGIGLTNPAYELDVVGDVNITGSYLVNGSPLTASNWQRTSGSLAPLNITDSINLGSTSTSSALVHLAGTTGENSWINTGTGNFGIGTTSPSAALSIAGTGNSGINIGGFFGSGYGAISLNNTADTTNYNLLSGNSITDNSLYINRALGGSIQFREGNGTAQMVIASGGNVGIGLTNPVYDLDVTGDINLTGAIYDNGSPGVAGQILSTTGTGVQWIDAPTSGGAQYWQWNGGVLSPTDLNDSVTLGATATNSATVHLAGKTGVNSFINTGNFGIGLTNPTAGKLQVAGGNIIVDSAYGLDTAAAGTLALGDTNATVINIGTNSTARAITLGNSTGATSVSLNGGTGNSVNVGTNAIAHTITVGNVTGATAVNVNTGTAGTTYTTTNGIFTLNTGTGNISLGTDAAAKNVTLGNVTGATSLALNSGTGDISLTSTDQIKLSSSKAAGATTTEVFSILSSVDLGSTDELLQIGDSAANMLTILGNGNVGIGLTNPGSTLTVVGSLTSSGGNISLNNDSNFTTNINTGTSTGAVTIGGGSNTVAVNSTSWDITTLGVASGFTGFSSSGNIDLASLNAGGIVKADVTTGRLSIASAGTDYEVPLTFSNGLTRSVNAVKLGGALTANTDIPLAGFNLSFSGTGNIGIGLTNPTQKFQVGNFFVVDTANSRIGIGTTTPTSTLEIAGASSVISNSSGDITFNSASGLFDFSNGSLTNFLNATASGQIKLGNFADGSRPTPLGTGSLIYSTTQNNPQFYNGTDWINLSNYFGRLATGTIYPTNWYDSINIGYASGGNGASSSATVRISGDATNSSFFVNPVAFGFRTDSPSTTSYIKQPRAGYTFAIETQGGILPRYTGSDLLGYENHEWAELHLADSIVKGGLGVITLNDLSLNTDVWHATAGFKVGTGALGAGVEFEVTGDASISQTLSVGGQLTVGGGAGKIDVGTVDPPYTINGKKYATYMASMIGIKEETVGKVTTTTNDYIEGLGYRTLIDLDQQPVGSDIWLFSMATNIQAHIGDLSVLLTPEGQAKAWFEVDQPNKILAIYSSTPTNISYRLTAPRFDSARWSNTRTSGSVGHVINNNTVYTNTNSIFDNNSSTIELIAKNDNSGTYLLNVNRIGNKEVSTFMNSIVANLKVGAATAISLITDNLTVRTKLISPIAEIDQLKVIDATISGTLYADNIKGQTVDNLNYQINLLDEKYSTASAILADLQAKYGTYASLFGATSSATVANDPLTLSPLAETTPVIPSDLALNSLNVHTLIANDLLANGSIFTKSISAFDTDLFIQPTGDKLVNISNNLMILYPNGKIVINGDLLVAGNVLAQGLTSETATVSGSLAIGSSSISTESANFAELTTGGLIIASGNDPLATISGQTNTNTTIGEATIAPSTGGISILNNKVTQTTLIYITPTSDTQGRVLYVKSKTEGVGFTVGITGNTNNPQVSFNYWLVETK